MRVTTMKLHFQSASTLDIETIRELAHRIWHTCYPGMISYKQIEFMLDLMYSPQKLALDLHHGVRYEIAMHAGKPVGYLGHELLAGGVVLHLHKIYLAPELHGQGHGQAMLAYVFQQATHIGATTVELRVNKLNARAVTAYERAGFVVAESLVQQIGQGFVMDDFVMRKTVAPE